MWTLLPLHYRIGAVLLLLAGIFCGGYAMGYLGEHDKLVTYEAQVQQQATDQAAQVKAILDQHKIDLDKAGKQHESDQAVINDLAARLNGVRIHIPVTPTCSNTGKADPGSNGASGVFSRGVDQAFARLQAGVDTLAKRCDQINIDTIKLNGSINK